MAVQKQQHAASGEGAAQDTVAPVDRGSDQLRAGDRVGLISLGCPKNRVDSEIMLGELRRQGFDVVEDLSEARTIIVNTCGFIDEAKEESIETLLEIARLKRGNQERDTEGGEDSGSQAVVERLVVAGCMASRYAPELAEEIPEIDAFVTLDQLCDVAPLASLPTSVGAQELVTLGGARSPAAALVVPPPAPSHVVFDHTSPRLLTTRGYAYLKVAEGCNNPCTFCAIPVWRGRFRSRTIDSLVQEAKQLQEQNIQELVLLAQDTTRYGEDIELGRTGLRQLVEALLSETDVPWIRFLYAYPTTLESSLIELMGRESRFVSYVDMPLQHSHPEVLSAMRRGGSPQRYLRQIEKIRHHAPDAFLRSTFIVGFPGETEQHFKHLLEFVEQAQFDHMGAFVFSIEDDTPSSRLPDQVPRETAVRRRDELMALQAEISLASRQRLVGKTLEVLVEGVCAESEHLLEGRHAGMAPEIDGRLLINDGLAPAGSMAQVEISEAFADDIVGHIVGPEGAPGVVPAEFAISDRLTP